MPQPKYNNAITLGDDGRWRATVKGHTFEMSYGSLDDAVDAILMEESFSCSRIPAIRKEGFALKLRNAQHLGKNEDARVFSELVKKLEIVAEAIRERARQELTEDGEEPVDYDVRPDIREASEEQPPIHPEIVDWGTVFAALAFAIRCNSGIGFHNGDQGHPYYVPSDEPLKLSTGDGDGPESNQLFMMLRDLSRVYGVAGSESHPRIETWREFCDLAHRAYLKGLRESASQTAKDERARLDPWYETSALGNTSHLMEEHVRAEADPLVLPCAARWSIVQCWQTMGNRCADPSSLGDYLPETTVHWAENAVFSRR